MVKEKPNPQGGNAHTKGWVSRYCSGGLAPLPFPGLGLLAPVLGPLAPPWPSRAWALGPTRSLPLLGLGLQLGVSLRAFRGLLAGVACLGGRTPEDNLKNQPHYR